MIDLTKTYKTKDGSPARFLAQIKNSDYPLIFAVSDNHGDDEHIYTYNKNGKFYSEHEDSDDDLVEYNPWAELPIDTPIYVTDDLNGKWFPRHFAGFDTVTGSVLTFDNGRTSFTVTDKDGYYNTTSPWTYAKLKDEA